MTIEETIKPHSNMKETIEWLALFANEWQKDIIEDLKEKSEFFKEFYGYKVDDFNRLIVNMDWVNNQLEDPTSGASLIGQLINYFIPNSR